MKSFAVPGALSPVCIIVGLLCATAVPFAGRSAELNVEGKSTGCCVTAREEKAVLDADWPCCVSSLEGRDSGDSLGV